MLKLGKKMIIRGQAINPAQMRHHRQRRTKANPPNTKTTRGPRRPAATCKLSRFQLACRKGASAGEMKKAAAMLNKYVLARARRRQPAAVTAGPPFRIDFASLNIVKPIELSRLSLRHFIRSVVPC